MAYKGSKPFRVLIIDTQVSYFEDELEQISIYIDKDVQEKKDLKQVTENLHERLIITGENLQSAVIESKENINKLSERLIMSLFAIVTGVIDWEQAIYGSASSAVISGRSILAYLEGASCYSVNCMIEVENWTKYPLITPESCINGGIIKSSLVVVLPGQREQFVQVLEFGTGAVIKRGLFKDIGDFVTDELQKIIHTRFKMPNVEFKKRFDCGLIEPKLVTGSNEFSEEEITEYLCGSCTTLHPFIGEWSKEGHEALSLSMSPEDVPRYYPNAESLGQIQTTGTSTKVRVRVQAGERVFSNINDEATGTVSSSGFSKEEINFTKMGMIVLNILADVLYDLLKPDKPHLRSRCNCDITYLYSEHRKLNKHVPSNSNHRQYPHGPWGGCWQDIHNTDIAIGDDIERIRLTRNELQHSQIFKLDEIRYNELCSIVSGLLNRFDQHNKPARMYADALNEILAKTVSAEEAKSIENGILGMTIEVEIEQ
ncbi:Hypothetical predicted protein [Mytilus galloprovincialis]|uniref:DZIP3-like HEPN domain-containing protein n=1 Tax=Mytilus galloprovincialis TaxID=29158 RepID=A0A8B6ECW2_MYTGA|nr:Hypothetical predicted protein [Mytilus galloprovincialis]